MPLCMENKPVKGCALAILKVFTALFMPASKHVCVFTKKQEEEEGRERGRRGGGQGGGWPKNKMRRRKMAKNKIHFQAMCLLIYILIYFSCILHL